jgi:IS605 OrfB family transposase
VQLTYRFRLRDCHAAELDRQAVAVSFVWNYCNETQQKAVRMGRRWLSAVDLMRLTAGAAKELDLHAHTIQGVCKQYERSRRMHHKAWLRYRGRKALGWVPFNTGHVAIIGQSFKFRGKIYRPMHWREFPAGAIIGAGTFSQDANGHWYINCPVEVPEQEPAPFAAIGFDLGLKTLATGSDGSTIENLRHYRQLQDKLGLAQRANKRKLARNIHQQIKNARRDQMHKISAEIARSHDVIVVGNVSAAKLAQTRMAKSVLDASWSVLRSMLSYKAMRHGGKYIQVDERLTTQVCSECGCLPAGRPKGIADLGIREWTCGDCGVMHDRDINSARNILRLGLETLAEGARA